MKDNFDLLDTLENLFAGDRQSILTLDEFLGGLHGRSYAFAIAALNIPNCIPTGIPWLSTITGLPMVFLLVQFIVGREVPTLPAFVGRRGIHRGKLQRFLNSARRTIRWLENTVHARHEWNAAARAAARLERKHCASHLTGSVRQSAASLDDPVLLPCLDRR
jgi:hypothetical protein